MALTVETGAIVPGADTYVTVDELRAHADKRGYALPDDDSACEVLLTLAMDYLAMQSQRWKGEKRQSDQPLDWPRYGVEVDGYDLPSDTIPLDIKRGQMQLAIDGQTVELLPTLNAADQRGPVTEETVDVITTRYGTPSVNRSVSWFQRADAFLARYYGAGMNQVRLVRG